MWLVLFGLLFLAAAIWIRWLTETPAPSDDSAKLLAANKARAAQLEAREAKMDQTVWAKEMLAQTCARTFESLWDQLNTSSNKLQLVACFPVGEVILGHWDSVQALPHAIELRNSTAASAKLSADQWRHLIEDFRRDGWQLENVEFRQERFDTDAAGRAPGSRFYFAARLENPKQSARAILEGDLLVDWASNPAKEQAVGVKRIDASRLTIMVRHGEPVFRPILVEEIKPSGKSGFIDPLILYDLDGDGLSEIILAARNVVYRRRSGNRYEPEPLCRYPPGPITTAVIADFDGDGYADLLCAKAEGLLLYKGSAQGTFDEPGRLVWSAHPHLANAMVMTCGDIDQDGDLDVFIGQYRVPTLGQVLHPHYYDANDGHPAYLLLNDGHGNFTDVTLASGLGQKRWRRTYSASFADLEGGGNLDLMVVSDFAGLDLYRNDGHGHFTDVTGQWVSESHGFGMAHAVADFNDDGKLDFLMIGMPSPTVDRLEHLGLWRPDAIEDHTMRSRMTFGNRLYLARASGGFEQTSMSDSIARSGWSWGCSTFDFDNDGFPDVYIANGLQSNRTVQDYESFFWLHDIYVDDSVDDVTATAFFMAQYGRTRGKGWSYGGYEKNRLYLNQGGRSFVEVGHLMGVALEQDCRNVVADDLDGDGRMDLLVTTFEFWPEIKQTLRVFRNALPDAGHWIGFRFREEVGVSPVGVRVTIFYDGHTAVRELVTGDSHRSQHANTVHFGLGNATRVDKVEIRWPNGQSLTLHDPATDCYHQVRPPHLER